MTSPFFIRTIAPLSTPLYTNDDRVRVSTSDDETKAIIARGISIPGLQCPLGKTINSNIDRASASSSAQAVSAFVKLALPYQSVFCVDHADDCESGMTACSMTQAFKLQASSFRSSKSSTYSFGGTGTGLGFFFPTDILHKHHLALKRRTPRNSHSAKCLPCANVRLAVLYAKDSCLKP